MTRNALRAALGIGATALTLASIDLYLIIRRPAHVVVSPIVSPARNAQPTPAANGTAASPTDPTRPKRQYAYRDPRTGNTMAAFLPDDRAKLDRFIASAHLGAGQAAAVRGRFQELELKQAAIADEMSRANQWDWKRVRDPADDFWNAELDRLPDKLSLSLGPEFRRVQK